MVGEICTKRKVECGDISFTRRQVRDITGWGDTQLKVHLSRLVELEYVIAHRADHGQGLVYELVYDGAGKDGKRFLSGLLDTEKLRRAHDYDAQRSGVNDERSGSGRPPVGGQSGSGRPAQNDVNALTESELPTRPALNGENAHLDEVVLAVVS